MAAETPAVGDDGLDVFFVHPFRFQKFADMMAVLMREGFVVDVVQIADGFPVIFVTAEDARHCAHGSADSRCVGEKMVFCGVLLQDLFGFRKGKCGHSRISFLSGTSDL